MTDRELLELAAKADGEVAFDQVGLATVMLRHGEDWNPLTDDGDEARLEAALNLWVSWHPDGVLVGFKVCGRATGSVWMEYFDQHDGDKQAARRRAGVCAAAEIGKAMP